MKPTEMASEEVNPRGLETLVECLLQYVKANPSRFTVREAVSDRGRILTVVPAYVTNQP
jgi:hypothetical protein